MTRDDWLTATRVDRLPLVLQAVRSYPPSGLPADRAERIIWRACGGPLDEVGDLLAVLLEAGLVSGGSSFRVTKDGRQVATQDHHQGGTMLARRLIRSGFFAEQSRRLVEAGTFEAEGSRFVCARGRATEIAAQLVGVLRRFEGVEFAAQLVIPEELLQELLDVWTMLPAVPKSDRDRKKLLGNRGELYSYRMERLRSTDVNLIRWVARDDDFLGYDIEDAGGPITRLIEVKASGQTDVRFMLSANEWDVAQAAGEAYEVHFWGGIDLARRVEDEYEILIAQGFPLVFRNVPSLVSTGMLEMRPLKYVIEQPGESQ